jgi:hypothetical protein
MKKRDSGAQFVRDYDNKNKTQMPKAEVVRAAANAGYNITEKTVSNVRWKKRYDRANHVRIVHAKRPTKRKPFDGPARGRCPLCDLLVSGAILDGVWLPKRGDEHQDSCPNASTAVSEALVKEVAESVVKEFRNKNEEKLRAVAIEIGLGRSLKILENWRSELAAAAS